MDAFDSLYEGNAEARALLKNTPSVKLLSKFEQAQDKKSAEQSKSGAFYAGVGLVCGAGVAACLYSQTKEKIKKVRLPHL